MTDQQTNSRDHLATSFIQTVLSVSLKLMIISTSGFYIAQQVSLLLSHEQFSRKRQVLIVDLSISLVRIIHNFRHRFSRELLHTFATMTTINSQVPPLLALIGLSQSRIILFLS